jgi:hypothetical protein
MLVLFFVIGFLLLLPAAAAHKTKKAHCEESRHVDLAQVLCERVSDPPDLLLRGRPAAGERPRLEHYGRQVKRDDGQPAARVHAPRPAGDRGCLAVHGSLVYIADCVGQRLAKGLHAPHGDLCVHDLLIVVVVVDDLFVCGCFFCKKQTQGSHALRAMLLCAKRARARCQSCLLFERSPGSIDALYQTFSMLVFQQSSRIYNGAKRKHLDAPQSTAFVARTRVTLFRTYMRLARQQSNLKICILVDLYLRPPSGLYNERVRHCHLTKSTPIFAIPAHNLFEFKSIICQKDM